MSTPQRIGSGESGQTSIQLVLHYDGAHFAGWQRQTNVRTVQGELENSLARLCGRHVRVTGAGRTDAGVHARGQSAGVTVDEDRWDAISLRRALNAVLTSDIWVAQAHAMRPEFHPRFSATSREYSYSIGTDEGSRSPFRARMEWGLQRPLDPTLLRSVAALLPGEHSFRAFAVQGTAPSDDDHRCTVTRAEWHADAGQLIFRIAANRFLHHMVRFLVGTMVEIGTGRRSPDDMSELLHAASNRGVSPPAPPHGLVLERVEYPADLYLRAQDAAG